MEIIEVRFLGHGRTEFVELRGVVRDNGYLVVHSPLFYPEQNLLATPEGEIFSHLPPEGYRR